MAEAKQSTQKTTRAATGRTEASKVETDETGILREDVGETEVKKAVETGDTDKVAMVSRHADGTPAQTPGFTYLDPAAAREASEKQLTEQAVSNADQVVRAPAEAGPQGGEGSSEPDPAVSRIAAAHEQAAELAQARVEDEHGKDER